MLVSLAKGRPGTETATLTEALLVAGFWQAALGRVQVAPARRRPFFSYADEFQDVIRLSEATVLAAVVDLVRRPEAT